MVLLHFHMDLDVELRTVHFLQFCYICPTYAQYMLTIICLLWHRYMFRCLYIILREFLIMYDKVTK